MPIIQSRVLWCSRNRAAVHDVHSAYPTQTKKPVKQDESRTPLPKEQVQPIKAFSPIKAFRTPSLVSDDFEDFEDLLSIKRANHIYDSDEEDPDFRFVKRQRTEEDDEEETTGESTMPKEVILHWSDRVVEDEEQGYLLSGVPRSW